MLRTNTCGELRAEHTGSRVTLCGWVQKIRELGGMTFIDLRDRYGITQLVFNMDIDAELCNRARELGREFVLSIEGEVKTRSNKNPEMETGDVEILVEKLVVLNASKVPPFTIENETDGGEEIRMKYRYLDLRREVQKNNLILRHKVLQETRKFLSDEGFLEIETPFLINSTPEGARDFIVPSRTNEHQFYALPQSPQTFKQLLMVGGFDKYFQIVRCFRDEDLRADRQPEFTQIDCEMTFVQQEDVLNIFGNLVKHLFKQIKNIDIPEFEIISHADALSNYGTDKPDMRFDMKLIELTKLVSGKGFNIFDDAEKVAGIVVKGCASYSRKQTDELIEFVTRPQIGAKGLIFAKWEEDGNFKSSVDKFFNSDDLAQWANAMGAEKGDLMLIVAGDTTVVQRALSELRLEMGNRLELRKPDDFKPLFVVDFPLFRWSEEEKRWDPLHHPFTSPKEEDLDKLDDDPGAINANAYDLVINGIEIAG